MRTIIALLNTNSKYQQFALPELKVKLYQHLALPFEFIFRNQITSPQIKLNNFPYAHISVPDSHLDKLSKVADQSVLVNKIVMLISQGRDYQELIEKADDCWIDQNLTNSENSYSCWFESRNRKLDKPSQIYKINNTLERLRIKGKISLSKPTLQLALFEDHTLHNDNKSVQERHSLKQVYFGILLSSNKDFKTGTKFHSKYDLSNRLYLGPTSVDNDLAFLMAHQAKLQKGHIVYDPFVGTGSLLIPAAYYGAITYGSDIDERIINGNGVGRLNRQSTYYDPQYEGLSSKQKLLLNFKQYGLEYPVEIKQMDCLNSNLKEGQFIDAIITDPPYGIRTISRKAVQQPDYQHDKLESIKKQQIYFGLFTFAVKHLNKGGRLVFFYPILAKEGISEISERSLPHHPSFEILDYSCEYLTQNNVRVLITMVKR